MEWAIAGFVEVLALQELPKEFGSAKLQTADFYRVKVTPAFSLLSRCLDI